MYTLKNGEGHFLSKTNENATHTWRKGFKQIGLVFCLLLTAFVKIHAQDISLDVTDEPFIKVLDEIKKQSQYDVFYNKALMREAKNVTLKIEKLPLKQALDKLFENQPLNYSIANNTIVVMPKKKAEPAPAGLSDIIPLQSSQGEVIRGKVLDYKSRPLAGVLVQYDQSYFFTYTNSEGDFSIPGTRGTIITFSGAGLGEREIRFEGGGFLLVQMEPIGSSLQNVKVSAVANKVKDPTTHIDLTNRSYMNLGQVLQGTIPGVSLQTVNSTATVVTGVQVWQGQQYRFVYMTLEQFLNTYPTTGQQIIDAKLSGNIPSWMNPALYYLTTITTVKTTLVPQLRGVNSFSANLSGMLVVIDGFPKDGFPSDYSMNNVESIEVIKDPKELIKWGPKAATGVILIKTKPGKSGQLQVNYATNMYYAPAPRFNRSQMQLAGSADILDYLRQADSVYKQNTYTPATTFNVSPASRLLNKLYFNLVTQSEFDRQWDSLGQLNNDAQLRNLQQNAFSHNHTLSLMGGNNNYKFSVIGGYNSTKDNGLNGYSNTASLNMNNSFNLLNDNLTINWLVYASSGKTRAGYSLNPSNMTLAPYQMLLDGKGNYIYDYTMLSAEANATIEKLGYKNYGVNILEDARLNKNTTNAFQGQTRFNFNWKLLPGLQWTGSFYYSKISNTNDNFYDKQSSYARQLVDQYGEYRSSGVNFYVPYGNILQRNKSTNTDVNLRTGLTYSKSFGKSDIELSVGGGGASREYRQPASNTLYGYNTNTQTGAPVFLPTPDPKSSILNFFTLFGGNSTTVYPYSLTVPGNMLNTNSRNINWNAGVRYSYDNRFRLSGNYNSAYNPNYGQTPPYSVMAMYSGDATLKLFRKPITSYLDNVSVSTGLTGVKMPDLPIQYTNTRYQQVYWGNYTIWVNGYAPTQQSGQTTENRYQRLTLDLAGGKVEVSGAFNTSTVKGLTSTSSSASVKKVDSSSTIHYISAGLKARLRKDLLTVSFNYSKSPEGQSQVNGDAQYNIAKESYFHSTLISTLEAEALVQNVSPYQALGLMMGTNVANAGSYSIATNSSFNTLPPKNTNYEARARIGIKNDLYMLDLRYYNHTTSGLGNNISVASDASTGLSSQVSYSNITNKGVEFFLKTSVVQRNKFTYAVTLNGAYNVNIARQVPVTGFNGTDAYATAYRDGYNTSNVWTYKWAGLDNQGNPQIYNAKGEKTAVLDSSTLASSLVYSGTFKAPWTGGLIHDVTFGQFFGRMALTFNWGGVMRRYIPAPNSSLENSILIKDRWKKPGDELYTDIPAMSPTDNGTSYRSYVVHNSSISIMSANYVRLQEIMLGWRIPDALLKHLKVRSAVFTVQVQNAAVWTQNKYHLDPATVGSNGMVSLPLTKQYSCSLNISL